MWCAHWILVSVATFFSLFVLRNAVHHTGNNGVVNTAFRDTIDGALGGDTVPKKATSYRLSEEALALVRLLKERHGVSEADVVEMALRRMARVDLADGKWPAAALLDAAAALIEKRR